MYPRFNFDCPQRPVFCQVYLCAGAAGEQTETVRAYEQAAMRRNCTRFPGKTSEELDTWPAGLGARVRLKRSGERQIEVAARTVLPSEVSATRKSVRVTATERRRDGIIKVKLPTACPAVVRTR